jgi:hypothetical protein
MCMLCRSLFVLLYLFFWPLCCLFVLDLPILITSLVSSNSSYLLSRVEITGVDHFFQRYFSFVLLISLLLEDTRDNIDLPQVNNIFYHIVRHAREWYSHF